jgi:hypothetical protein
MTATPTTKTGQLELLDAERAAWEALLAEVGERPMERPGAAGDWTFKDVVAHLNGWRERTVAKLEAAARGQEPSPPPWPTGLDEDSDEDVDAINRWLYERDRDRSAAEVVAESREQFGRMRAAVEQVSEADLFQPGRYAWLGDYPLSAVLDGSYGHLHEEHEPGIRRWLAGDRSPDQHPAA